MKLDTGLIVVILAVLIFYLRLIILQRQRVKRINAVRNASAGKAGQGKKSKGAAGTPAPPPNYSVLSPIRRDRVIGVVGAVLILLGVFLYSALNPWPAAQAFWWIPTAVGIVAFSWLFRLGAVT